MQFDYNTAFSRNIGWLTDWEQQKLRQAKVAVAGAGGVGGIHLQTLARLGFSRFHVADLDRFELANFNRQAGANMATLDREKAIVARELVHAINPDANVTVFDQGVSEDNLSAFLDDVDIYIDGLDFFVLDLRAKLFRAARADGVTAITAAPIGMGTGYLVFTPTSMSFDDFFDLGDNADSLDGAAAFLLGLTPAMLQRGYIADPSRVDLAAQRGPSTAIACQLCAGVAATEAVRAVLGRPGVKPVPYYHHFDPYRGRFITRKLIGGARNPIQRVKRTLVGSLTGRLSSRARPPEPDAAPDGDVMDRVLEAGRWAPSADNTQPWTFEKKDAETATVRVRYDPANIYEYGAGEPTRLAAGMLLETMRLRALALGHRFEWEIAASGEGSIDMSCRLLADDKVRGDPLHTMIEARRTVRQPLSPRAIEPDVLSRLAAAAGPEYSTQWHEGWRGRFDQAVLNAKAASLRLRIAETHPIHEKVVRFESRYPRWGLPSRALGLSPWAHALMGFALKTSARSNWLLGRLGGAFYAALEMDILPGMMSGAHFSLTRPPARDGETGYSLDEDLAAGAAIQRLWLAAALEGLDFQPACAPICFARYGRDDDAFSAKASHKNSASRFAKVFARSYGKQAETVVYRGRIGHRLKKPLQARSLRQTLTTLLVQDPFRQQDEAPVERPPQTPS